MFIDYIVHDLEKDDRWVVFEVSIKQSSKDKESASAEIKAMLVHCICCLTWQQKFPRIFELPVHIRAPNQPRPFSMPSKLYCCTIFLFFCFTVSFVSDRMFNYLY